jgi:choice-of-anchor C domain-containing protein
MENVMLARHLKRFAPALLLAVAAPAGAQIVTNGGFEQPAALASITPTVSVPGWTASSGNFEIITTGLWQPHGGTQSIDLNGTSVGTIFQDLATEIGATYRLSFWYAGNPGTAENKTFDVLWDGSTVGSPTFVQTGTSRQNMGWVNFLSGNLAATSTITRLTFQSTSPNAFSGPALDDVEVTLLARSTVPEPSTYVLFATGLTVLAGIARRRKA